jgi:hypothetical protein
LLLARRLVNGRERGCLQVVSCSVLRLVNMSTRAMRLKTQARALACLQVVYLTLSVVKEQSLSASLVRLEKELFPLYLGHRFATRLRLGGHPRALPRFPATMASSDYCFRFRYTQSSRVPLLDLPDTRPSYAPPHPLTPKSSRCGGVGFTHTETLTTRK